ncbi:MAG: aminotransferase class IV family protein [Candidatus Sumerlaeia bacterium]|nr:aminotransferase class IV family protein [Candidatus Sumerlaeia bacterium]
MPIIYFNGKFLEQAEAALDPLDRGVTLGDGLFETIRCEEGQLIFHVAHLARLARGARLLEIPWNLTSEEFLAICHQVLDANDLKMARLRVTLTRGEPSNSPEIGAPQTAPPLVINAQALDQSALNAARERGWSAHLVDFPRNHRSPLAQIKSTSYQECLLARQQARRKGADEGILLNTDGRLAEGAMSNLFIVRKGNVYTPPVADGALPGIVRLKVGLLCARQCINHEEKSLTIDDLRTADEIFMTNSIIEIMPVVRLGDDLIGNGKPGSATQAIHGFHRRDVGDYLGMMRTG